MQKEKLSALMDGETLDNELLNELSRSSEMQKTWESYHLIRDTLRGDTAEVHKTFCDGLAAINTKQNAIFYKPQNVL